MCILLQFLKINSSFKSDHLSFYLIFSLVLMLFEGDHNNYSFRILATILCAMCHRIFLSFWTITSMFHWFWSLMNLFLKMSFLSFHWDLREKESRLLFWSSLTECDLYMKTVVWEWDRVSQRYECTTECYHVPYKL